MRTFNGLQIFTEQLTNSGQLDLRYVRISGNTEPANIFLGNLTEDYDFHFSTNFNISKTLNIFYTNNGNDYTGYMPDVVDKKIVKIKNLSNFAAPLTISGYASNQIFDLSDELLSIGSLQGADFLGVKNDYYTGWINIAKTNGISF